VILQVGAAATRAWASAPSRTDSQAARTSLPVSVGYGGALLEKRTMGWLIGRAEAVSNPQAAKQKALAKLRNMAELDDPESLVVPILVDALLLVESLRGARHQITFVPELTQSVDALLRELTIIEKTQEWVEP
jgi:hypothetical protein